jgi:hypothetical protein
MDAKLKANWIEALRSGKYQQARKYLRQGNGFCCLGVACDLIDSSEWGDETSTGAYYYGPSDYDALTVWSGDIEARYGLTPKQSEVLWRMNDEGNSFAEIADYIEANL